MKTGGLKLAIQAAVLAILMPAAASAGDVSAKLELCQSCHGLSYQGYSGHLALPRFAGQTPEYITNQLKAFAERKRERGLFFKLARTRGFRPACRTRWHGASRACTASPWAAVPGASKTQAKSFTRTELRPRISPACASCHGKGAEGKRCQSPFGRSVVSIPCQRIETLERSARPGDGTRRPKEEGAHVERGANRKQ